MTKDKREKIGISIRLKKIVVAYAYKKGISKQETYRLAIKGLFDDIPKLSEQELLSTWDLMTEEQRKYPTK